MKEPIQGPDWDDIRIFLAVAETGSLTAAAEGLGISQPTAGRRLRALEQRLGLRLVEREANRVTLTPAGQSLRARAARMQDAADGVMREARAAARGPEDPVRITATGSVALYLASRMGRLADLAGGTRFVLEAEKGRVNLARREADLAIRMRRVPAEGDMLARRLGEVAFCLYGPANPGQGELPVIGLPETGRRPSQSGHVEEWASGRTILLRTGEPALRHAAMKSAGAAGLLPCWMGDADPDLVRLAEPPPSLKETAWLLVHRNARRKGAVDRAAGALVELFRADAGLLSGRPSGGVSL